jgi:hypothetical protein
MKLYGVIGDYVRDYVHAFFGTDEDLGKDEEVASFWVSLGRREKGKGCQRRGKKKEGRGREIGKEEEEGGKREGIRKEREGRWRRGEVRGSKEGMAGFRQF